MSHYVVKLYSGEIVYGTIEKDNADPKMIIINNPLVWEDYESEDGRVGSALVKYLVGTDESKIPISINSITSMALMSKTFSSFYDVATIVTKITDEAYRDKLSYMTKNMLELVSEYQAKQFSNTGDIITSHSDLDTTIH